jgi:histidine triad (HIT) family protein
MTDCLFCNIVLGKIDSNSAGQNDLAFAFFDIAPVAPIHILIVPKRHIENANELQSTDAEALAKMMSLSQELAEKHSLTDKGYRLVFNVGDDAGNTVPHLHMHLLGGRRLGWPPG